MDLYEAVTRIFLALVLGGIVGLERELTQKSAGLRTHILVTLGATIFTIVSMSDFYHGQLPHGGSYGVAHEVADPTRVAAQIVSGIGFIGGGAVLRYGNTVRGLTTAASLWTMAGIGMMVGIGLYRLAIIVTLLSFLVLFTIGKAERQFFRKSARHFNRLRVNITAQIQEAPLTQDWMVDHYSTRILETRTKTDVQTDRVEMNYILSLEAAGKMDVNRLSRELCRLDGVQTTTVKTYFEADDIA